MHFVQTNMGKRRAPHGHKYIGLLEGGSTMPHTGIALPPVVLFVAFRCFSATPPCSHLNGDCADEATDEEQQWQKRSRC